MSRHALPKKTLFLLSILVLLLTILPLSGKRSNNYEQYGTGGLEVEKKFQNTFPEAQAAASSIARGSSLPPRVDLSSKMPPAGNQRAQGSCTAWAVAYASHSYLVGIQKGWNLARRRHQFSPSFVFNQLTRNGRGIHIHKAMQLIVDQGCTTLDLMPYNYRNYTRRPSPEARQNAWLYRAKSWKRIRPNDQYLIKQKLHDGNVVVAAMYVYKRFYKFRSHNNVYRHETRGGYTPYGRHGRHAVTVVGYDDNKYGGAFKLLNSWGSHWGKKGYFWITYNYWNRVVYDAYVLYSKKGVTVNSKPDTPQNVTATSGLNNKIIISWDKARSADGYTVYRFNDSSQDWNKMGNTSRLFFTDKTAHPNIEYKYSIKSFNNYGISDFSAYAKGKRIKSNFTEKIARPSSISATKHLTGKITISWSEVEKAIAYNLYRWRKNRWRKIARVSDTTWSDTDITQGKTYYYCVAAIGSGSISKKSKFTTGKAVKSIYNAKPIMPTNFDVSRNHKSYIKISWDKVNNATHYLLYRWKSQVKKWFLLKKTSSTSYKDYIPRAGQKTYYAVAAANGSGRSEFTKFKYGYKKRKSGFVKGQDIPVIEELKVSKGTYADRISVSWENLGRTYSYFVFRWRQKTRKWKQLARVYTNKYIDRTAHRGEVYYYSIRAAIGRRYGDASDSLSGYTSNDDSYFNSREFEPENIRRKPDIPSQFGVQYVAKYRMNLLRWKGVSSATLYYIVKWNPYTRKWVAAGWTRKNYFYDRKTRHGQTNFYAVYARNKFGFSKPTKHLGVFAGARQNSDNQRENNNDNREE